MNSSSLHSLAAEFGPYLLLIAVLLLAAAWALRRARRGGAVALDRLSLDEIQALLRESFQAQGYQLAEPAVKADSRNDLMLRRGRETFLVWAKPWREQRVGVEAVQQVCRAMAARGAGGGFVVTTGRFGRDASTLASSHNVRLIDGAALRDLLPRGSGSGGR